MGQLDRATRRDILAAALRDHGLIALAPTLDAAIDFVNAYAPEHLSVDVEPLEPTVDRLRNAGSLFVGPWAPESAGDYATGANHVLPDRRPGPRLGRPVGRGVRQVRPGPADRPRRAGLDPCHDRHPGRGRGPPRAPRRRRDPLRGPSPMSPTPVTFNPPNAPSTYSWEATDEEVAARYGLDPSSIVRFDLNTSPAPPALAQRLLAAGRFEAPLSEYPPTDYRRLVEAAAARYGVTRIGDPRRGRRRRDPRHRRQGVHPGRRAGRRPGPDLCDVPGPHRAARRPGRRGPATRRGGGLVARPRGHARRRPGRLGRVAVQPEQPDRAGRSRTARSATCSSGSPRMLPRPAGPPRSSSSTRPTPSSSGRRSSGCATSTRT